MFFFFRSIYYIRSGESVGVIDVKDGTERKRSFLLNFLCWHSLTFTLNLNLPRRQISVGVELCMRINYFHCILNIDLGYYLVLF